MRKKKASPGDVVRAWRDNIAAESGNIPALIIVGGKVLLWHELMSNIAIAADLAATGKVVCR